MEGNARDNSYSAVSDELNDHDRLEVNKYMELLCYFNEVTAPLEENIQRECNHGTFWHDLGSYLWLQVMWTKIDETIVKETSAAKHLELEKMQLTTALEYAKA